MTDKEKLTKIKKLADAMYLAAQYLTTDASRLHKAMDEYHLFIVQHYSSDSLPEEPASKDLEEEYHRFLEEEWFNTLAKPKTVSEMMFLTAQHFTQWQREQMMAKAINAVVSQVPCSNEIILYNPSSVDKYFLPQEMNKLGLNKGDKIKLVIIKED